MMGIMVTVTLIAHAAIKVTVTIIPIIPQTALRYQSKSTSLILLWKPDGLFKAG